MKPRAVRFWFFSVSILFWLFGFKPAEAQIIPDNTLPDNSTVTSQGNIRVIEGGTQRGNNLFHSFREFSFSVLTAGTTGDTAFFKNDLTVKNIITRVTGGSISNIDGILQAQNTANLFFINPNGIIFGPNASLQIGGSFVASTANSLKLADGTEFNAIDPTKTSPLLTVSVPIGLQFGANPGEIVNQSQVSQSEVIDKVNPPVPVGLQVLDGRTLALVGGNLSLTGGNLTATDGRIELGSVANSGLVNLNELETGYALEYTNIQNFGEIQLSGGALIDTSGNGGGSIQLYGKNITLTENSQIFAYTLGNRSGGNLVINATGSLRLSGGSFIGTFAEGEGRAGDVLVRARDSIELVGTTLDNQFPSGIGSQVCTVSLDCESVSGNGGNLSVETRRLLVLDGAIVAASTFGAGRAGDVLVKTRDSVELIGTSPDGQIISGIFAQVEEGATDNAGDAGNLTIETRSLAILQGAQVSTAARGGGKGGNLTINAFDSIKVSGALPTATPTSGSSGIFVSAELGAIASVGNLNITTGLLTVENGAKISADNFGTGQPGSMTLNVRQLVIRDGGLVRAGSFGEGDSGSLIVNAAESVEIIGTGNIGLDRVNSTISVSSTGSGRAGNLQLNARFLKLDDRGKLQSESAAADGGNVTLNLRDLLLLRRNSSISTNAGTLQKNGNGGNITINTPFIVAIPTEDSNISANAFTGKGGKVDITANGIFGIVSRQRPTTSSDITASSERGIAGVIEINRPEVDPTQGLVELPINLVDVSQQVATGCAPGGKQRRGSFTVTGRGGIAPSPTEPLMSDSILADWVTLPSSIGTTQSREEHPIAIAPSPPTQIIEASSWVTDSNGDVVLVATTPNSPTLPIGTCPGS